MKAYWLIPILVGILFMGSVIFSQEVFAPSPQKPEKLAIESLSWDGKSQEFLVEYLIQYGIGTAGENGNFVIVTTLSVNNNGHTRTTPAQNAIPQKETTYDNQYYYGIQISVPFDPVSNGVEGPVDITVEGIIFNSSGTILVIAESKTFEEIELNLPPEICDDKIDNDGDGLIDLADPDCLNEQP